MAHVPEDAVQAAQTFGEVARALAAGGDATQILQHIVELAVEHLQACEYAGITLVEGTKVSSPASSHDVPKIVDHIQSETGQGPCVDAVKEKEIFETGHLSSEQRWPKFSQRAFDETGVNSVLSLRLFVEENTLGALNLYSRDSDAFDDSDVAMGLVFAAHAAVALQSSRRQGQLEEKVRSRDVIGQAKGILMARSGVDEDEAFEMLRSASQRTNVKLRRLAEQIASGEPLQQEAD